MAEETPDTQEGNGLSRRDLLAKAGAGRRRRDRRRLAGGRRDSRLEDSFATPKIRAGRHGSSSGSSPTRWPSPRTGWRPARRTGARSTPTTRWRSSTRGLNIKPALATSWKFETRRRSSSTCARACRFHNGKELTADDVVYSVKNMKNPPPPGSLTVAANVPATIISADAVSKYVGAAEPVGAGRPHRRLLRLAALRADRPGRALRPDQREPAARSAPARTRWSASPRSTASSSSATSSFWKPGQPYMDAITHEGDDRRAGTRRRPAGRRDRRGDALGRRGPVAPRARAACRC